MDKEEKKDKKPRSSNPGIANLRPPFEPGNKFGKGRVTGSKHQATIIAEEIGTKNVASVYEKLLEKALDGNLDACKFIINKVVPDPKGRFVKIPINPVSTLEDVAKAQEKMIGLVADGEVTIEEADRLCSIIDYRRKTIETTEIEKRLLVVEKMMKDQGL